jgi:predicted DNA repair protein MutK
MFLVGGGIIAHALPAVHAAVHRLGVGAWEPLVEAAVDLVIGLGVGLVAVGAVSAARAGYSVLGPRTHAASRP